MQNLTLKDALNLAIFLHNKGALKEAENIYNMILKEFPEAPDALHLLGLTYHQKNSTKKAIELIKKAISLSPKNPLYYHNLAMLYDSLKNEESSKENFLKAVNISPNYKNAHLAYYNLAIGFANNGKLEVALNYYNKALSLSPNFHDARWNRSLTLLQLGNFEEGWKELESRFSKKSPTDSRTFPKPKLTDLNIKDKTILVICEQGFGDAIQFARYLPLIKQKGAKIILECKKDLAELFKNSFEIDKILIKNSPISSYDYDFYIHLMSLPALFDTTLKTISNSVPYLKPSQELVDKFKIYFNKNSFNIGIVWSGNPKQENDKNRSITLGQFKELLEIPRVKLFSLQLGQSKLSDKNILDLSDKISNFNDTAAIIQNLDLIISVDTSVAHLSGALNKPTFVLLSSRADWRWLLERSDSPWYPSMKLFRQKNPDSWSAVFQEVKEEIINLINNK